MNDDAILDGLVKRRAELIAELRALETAQRRLLDDVGHLDGAIKVYDRTYQPRKLHAPPLPPHNSRGVLAVLREATAPMSVREIVLAVLAKQGKDVASNKVIRDMAPKVRSGLSRYRKAGTVRSEQGEGKAALWVVVR